MSKRVLYREYDENGTLIKLECSHCHEIKTVDNFCKDKTRLDGYNNKCKECARNNLKKYYSRYYQENKEKIVEYQRQYHRQYYQEKGNQYYKNNKEKINKRHRQYYQENKEKINERHRKYYQENKEYVRQYYQENKEKINEQKHQNYQNNKEKYKENHRKYYQENKEKYKENSRRYYIKNKNKKCIQNHKRYKDNINLEIEKIYENVTKNLYPNNGIQYGIIYGVHCKVTDRWYIGQTTSTFNIRYKGDFFTYKFQGLSEDNQKIKLLQDDIEKYEQDNFEIFEVIDVAFSEKELDEKEVYYIDYYKAYDEGYNSNRGNIFKHNKSKRKGVK